MIWGAARGELVRRVVGGLRPAPLVPYLSGIPGGPGRMSRILIIIGLLIVAVGVLWPWLQKIGLGRLPGDVAIRRDGFTFYAPIATCILISIAVSALFWFLRR
jgi:hypothetical protein